MYSAGYIWAHIISHLENNLTVPVVSSYLDDADIVDVSENKLVLTSPSEYRRTLLQGQFSDYIRDAAKELFNLDVEISVIGMEESKSYTTDRSPIEPFMFNPQFTFDRFVVGDSNRFAHAAALAVANNPAGAYNPLFIYGNSGLGKTHLLYSIAREIHLNNPDAKIVYIKGDQFTIELIAAIQEGKNVEFRNKYRGADLFLMDDIQFIAGKDSTQDEFFHTFNTLYEAKKQIVLTSDRPPQEMSKLDDRLRTRFEWGLIADIQAPDYETRMAIIKNKAFSLGVELSEDVCIYIAENLTSNVRQLEGAVKRLMAHRDLTGRKIDLTAAARALKDVCKEKAAATPGLIISEVCSFYSLDESVLRGSRRDKVTAEARQIAMYLIRKMTTLSLPDIGREFGKDHTTVIHAVSKIQQLIDDGTTGISENIGALTSNINSKL